MSKKDSDYFFTGVYICSNFRIISLSNGRYYSWYNAFSPNVISEAQWNMVCWGKMALWGKMERGKMAPFHLTPKGVSFCPNALVRFTPRQFHLRKLQWRKWLTHWGRDKMDAISQTPFSNAFSLMKIFEFRLKFHWSLFLSVQLTIFQHWFR